MNIIMGKEESSYVFNNNIKCAPGRNRTCNLLLRRELLYPLSYRRVNVSIVSCLINRLEAIAKELGELIVNIIVIIIVVSSPIFPSRLTYNT